MDNKASTSTGKRSLEEDSISLKKSDKVLQKKHKSDILHELEWETAELLKSRQEHLERSLKEDLKLLKLRKNPHELSQLSQQKGILESIQEHLVRSLKEDSKLLKNPDELSQQKSILERIQEWLESTSIGVRSLEGDSKSLKNPAEVSQQKLISDSLHEQWLKVNEVYKRFTKFWNPGEVSQQKLMSDEWEFYLKTKDESQLLRIIKSTAFIPSKAQLRKTCEIFGRKSPLLKNICDEICCRLRLSNGCEVEIVPCYRNNMKNDIIFVVFCDRPGQEVPVCELDIEIYRWDPTKQSCENQKVIEYIIENNKTTPKSKMIEMQQEINAYSKTLVENHSNITMITASPVKSTGYNTQSNQIIDECCIVILVPIKGLIPLQEDEFDKTIGSFTIDVREGTFHLHVGGKPSARHTDLKMGCEISAQNGRSSGTLGGFIEHPTYGLCALTCAHVLLREQDLLSLPIMKLPEPIACVQPPSASEKFGTAVIGLLGEKEVHQTGFDIAVIKIDQSRIPKEGAFPDIDEESLIKAGFSTAEEVKYISGKISDCMAVYDSTYLFKYGASTGLRKGNIGCVGATIPYKPTNYIGTPVITLRNQIQIYHNTEAFSESGDSGSLVFALVEKELIAVGLLIGGSAGCSIATPILDILRTVGCKEPLSLKQFLLEDSSSENIMTEYMSSEREEMEIEYCIPNLNSNVHSSIIPNNYQRKRTKKSKLNCKRMKIKRK